MANRLFPVPPPMTERQFESAVEECLTRESYVWIHVYTAKLADGSWRTTTTGQPRTGFPDLLALRAPWTVAVECKRSKNLKPTGEQVEWLTAVAELPYGRAWLLHPASVDWQDLANWLHRPERAPRYLGFEPSKPVNVNVDLSVKEGESARP